MYTPLTTHNVYCDVLASGRRVRIGMQHIVADFSYLILNLC